MIIKLFEISSEYYELYPNAQNFSAVWTNMETLNSKLNLFDLMLKFAVKSITFNELRIKKEFKNNPEVRKLIGFVKKHGHESLLFSYFPEVNLRSIIAIHYTKLGPATGGTRLWNYSSFSEALNDVLALSKAMTYKTAMADLNMGGGKAVIWTDPSKKSREMLLRYAEELKKLEGKFYTGEDANIGPEDVEVLAQVALKSVNGRPETADLGDGRKGSGDPAFITAKGVLWGIKAALDFNGMRNIKERTFAIQGLGKVGYELLRLLAGEGVSKIFCADINKAALDKASKEFKNIRVLSPKEIIKQKVDVYSPCLTLGGVINTATIPYLKCKIIAGATNNQLKNSLSDGKKLLRKGIIYCPDYVINAGGLINVTDELNPSGYSRERVEAAIQKIYSRVFQILCLSKKLKAPTNLIADALAEARIALSG